ncbi:MAG: hypothetical protein M3Z65_06300 [Chloroflexota bacterium]|nr:hypothetical protein [Chloroflexota bacterium]
MTALMLTSCGSLQGLANSCRASASESPIPSQPVIRTILLSDRWAGSHGSLCFSEVRVFDGRFLILGHTDGTPSMADPWFAALRGLSHLTLSDDTGRIYATSGTDARPGYPVGIGVDGLLPPSPGAATGDLLSGAHELTMQVDNVLDQIDGPWVFANIPARSGALDATATAAGRGLRLFDLVMRADGFSVAFMDLGGFSTPPFVGIRSPYAEFASARDTRGNTYAVAGPERIGQSTLLYMKFAPAPPPDASLTITLERIYVSSARTWHGTIRVR